MTQFDFVQDAFDSGNPIIVMKDGLWGLMDENTNILIHPKYNRINPFYYGFAAVEHDGLWGFINEKGEEIVTPKYSYVQNFTFYKIAIVSYHDSYNIIDENGVELLFKNFSKTVTTKHPIVFVCDGNDFWHVYSINSKSLKKLPNIYDFWQQNGYYVIQNQNGKVGLLDSNGNLVVKCNYLSITPLNEWLCIIYDYNDNCFVYDARNNSFNSVGRIRPEQLVQMGHNFYLAYRDDNDEKLHFIDTKNYLPIPNKYCDKIFKTDFGPLNVELDGKTGYLYL